MVGKFLPLEIELVVMAWLELQWGTKPSVVCSIADLKMVHGVTQMTANHLLPYGVTVLQLTYSTVITSFLQAADEFGQLIVNGVKNADIGVNPAVGIE